MEVRWNIKQLRTGGTPSSRGQLGHLAAEDRRDIKQQRTGRTSSSRGQEGHQAAEDN